MLQRSPYAIQYDWELSWKKIPIYSDKTGYVACGSTKERKILHLIQSIGVIDGKTLSRLFSTNKSHFKKRLKKMEKEHKIVKHELIRNGKILPFYTLGINGAVITQHDAYEPNYWLDYKITDVLKQILFFKVYQHFPDFKVIPTLSPFVGGIALKENIIKVYVMRDNANDLMNYLKWRKEYINDRIIIVVEKLKHVYPLLPYFKNVKARISTDRDLIYGKELDDLFYYFNHENGEILKEA